VGYDNAQLIVGEIEKQYTELPLIFDDTFVHSAKNEGDKTRIVLLFDFFHESFELAEIELLKQALSEFSAAHTTESAKEQAHTSVTQPANWFVH